GLARSLQFLADIAVTLIGGVAVARLHFTLLRVLATFVRILGLALLVARIGFVSGLGRLAALAGFILAVLGILLVIAEFLGHLHRHEHVADDPGKRALVLELFFQFLQVAARLLLHPIPPQPHGGCSAWRRFGAGQHLAHHHGNGLVERRVGTLAHAG